MTVLDEASILDFINEIRKEQGRRAIRKLPKGVPGDKNSCPIARAINHEYKASVGTMATYIDAEGKRRRRYLSRVATKFIMAFDARGYPDLIDKRATEIRDLKVRRRALHHDLKYWRSTKFVHRDEEIAKTKERLKEVNAKLKKLEKK